MLTFKLYIRENIEQQTHNVEYNKRPYIPLEAKLVLNYIQDIFWISDSQ